MVRVYKKELSFQVSCSYGPGRYDPAYEQQGHDYPIAFVRWTEQRNFQAVLHALSVGAIRTEKLISHRFAIEQATAAYDLLSSPEPSLGILFHHPSTFWQTWIFFSSGEGGPCIMQCMIASMFNEQ